MGSREQLLKEKANNLVSNQPWIRDIAFSVLSDEVSVTARSALGYRCHAADTWATVRPPE